MNHPTREEVAALLAYDPDTGVFRWRADRGGSKAGDEAGTDHNGGYRRIHIKGCQFLAHRLAFLLMEGKWPAEDVDHINGVRDDNRWSNLRDVSRTLNNQNLRSAKKTSKTGLLGVRPFRGRFRAQIEVNGQSRHLGIYDSPEVAHAAYVAAKRLHHEGSTL